MYTCVLLPTLPHPPEKFINLAKEAAADIVAKQQKGTLERKFNSNFVNRKLLRDGKEFNSRSLAGAQLGIEFNSWIRENIVSDFLEAGVRVSLGNNTNTHGAHTDGILDGAPLVKLNYFIDLGGKNVVTNFYQEHNQPLVRSANWPDVLTVDNYANLTLIEQIVVPVRTWTALNTNILHGVDNVTSTRINFTVVVDGRKFQFNKQQPMVEGKLLSTAHLNIYK